MASPTRGTVCDGWKHAGLAWAQLFNAHYYRGACAPETDLGCLESNGRHAMAATDPCLGEKTRRVPVQ